MSAAVSIGSDELQLCSFRVGDRLFGVSIDEVKEITTVEQVMPVPHAPHTVVGYVNIRGHIHLVLSLRYLMGYDGDEPIDEPRRMVVFKPSCGPAFGILIDAVGDIIRRSRADLVDRRGRNDDPPDGVDRRAARAHLIQGVCPLEDELVLVLKGKAFLEEFAKLG